MATPSSPSTPTHIQSNPMYGSSLPTLNFSSTNLDNEWKKWKLHFSIFLKASALDETEESRFSFIKERLLELGDVKLEKTIETAQNLETSRQHLQELESQSVVLQVKSQPKKTNDRRGKNYGRPGSRVSDQQRNKCPRCGQVHHHKCPATGQICKKCGKPNHYAIMCRSAPQSNGGNYVSRHNNIKNIEYLENLGENSLFVGKITSNQNVNSWDIVILVNNCNLNCQIDTGSQVNIMSKNTLNFLKLPLSRIQQSSAQLMSYCGNKIPVLGKISISCKIPLDKTYEIDFLVTELNQKTILGLKTSEELGLIKKLFTTNDNTLSNNFDQNILVKYNEVFEGIGLLPGEHKINIEQNVEGHVDPPRKIPFKLKERFKAELDFMVRNGIIEKVEEPCKFVSSLVCVEKPNKNLRICLDPRYINKHIIRPKRNIPTLESLTSELSGSKYFSVFDASNGFWSLKLDKESSKLTAFNTEFGIYRFLRMPYGITTASEEFQHALQNLLLDIPNLVVYIDDILIHAETKEEHDRIVMMFLERVKTIGLKLNKDKTQFCQKSVKFMGQIISTQGLRPQESKVKAIEDMCPPTNVKELQRFLGFVNYLGQYIKNLSQKTTNLRLLLKKNVPWHWNPNHQNEFENLKQIISSEPVLTFYDVNKELTLSVDASQDSMGAVILHNKQPIAYASKSMNESQKRYSQIEKELLAIVFGCVKFHRYIYGQKVKVETDHKPLVAIFNKNLSDIPQRLQRMMLKIQQYDLIVNHVPGKEMYLADTLSRAKFEKDQSHDETDKILSSLNDELRIHANFLVNSLNASENKLNEIRAETQKDFTLTKIISYIKNGWPSRKSNVSDDVKQYYNYKDQLHVIDGIVFKLNSIVIPQSMRNEMLRHMHEGHLGIVNTKNFVRGIIFWPCMNSEIENYIQNCQSCLKFRKNNTAQPLMPHEIPDIPWQKVGADIFQFESKYYIIIVDYYSEYFEIAPINSFNSQTVITQFKSIFCRHGIPIQLISDNGPPFNSIEFKRFCEKWNIKHVTSSPHYPKSNGLAERTIGTVKNIFRKCKDSGSDVYLGLLNFRNTPKADGIASPAKLLMSRNLRCLIPSSTSSLRPSVVPYAGERQKIVNRQERVKHYHDRKAKYLPKVEVGENILFKHNPKSNWIPAIVVQEIIPGRSFKIKTPEGVLFQRNREHLLKRNNYTPNSVPPSPNSIHNQSDNLYNRPRRNINRPKKFKDYVNY
ncbi:uncharacterized protein K02A2.6-like [Coccinella septempunctata]|uniref:uncharacterized protein K02A2.6-like n=1 Tax=Coccinella septempunctata TaxID=41139 RepID=UPI001D079471|nr:uncharacterized protein K02A2.6-like [Coccinella septempunctata]